jgi:bifunctional DNA-binding transcriptional regulator/antitoxin component of YhaV-PrlF toxin-antitoxin module
MTKVININQRGTLTLPKEMRDKLGLKDAGQVVAEETTQGVLIRAGVTFPIEIYTDKRVAEFDRANEQALRRYRLKTSGWLAWDR